MKHCIDSNMSRPIPAVTVINGILMSTLTKTHGKRNANAKTFNGHTHAAKNEVQVNAINPHVARHVLLTQRGHGGGVIYPRHISPSR